MLGLTSFLGDRPVREPLLGSFEAQKWIKLQTDLQWAMIGPASGGLQVFTLRRKARNGVGYSGTPWSGQAVNWNWRTSRFSLEPFCITHREAGCTVFALGHSVALLLVYKPKWCLDNGAALCNLAVTERCCTVRPQNIQKADILTYLVDTPAYHKDGISGQIKSCTL